MFDDAFLRRLELLRAAFARRAAAPAEGDRALARTGEGTDFAGHRTYAPGDDPRRIDWNAYARLGELFLKQFTRPAAERLSILIDTSASMAPKLEMARKVGAALYFVGSAGYARIDVNGREVHAAPEAIDALEKLAASGGGRPAFPGSSALKPRAAVLVSDFWWDDAAFFEDVRTFRASRGEAAWVRILTDDERDPEFHGATVFVDSESGERKRLFVTERELGDYRDAFRAHEELLRSAALAAAIPFASVAAEDPIEDVLFRELRAAGVMA